jgi:glycosyltransferase involved in cell wall biosynthesis
MKILFVHQNFPGQFKNLAPELHKLGHSIDVVTMAPIKSPGINYHRYAPSQLSSKNIFGSAVDFETKLIRGEACALKINELKSAGYQPDLIIVHPGWGESLFIREIYPNVKQLHYLEFFYDNVDVDFDPEFKSTGIRNKFRVRAKNAATLLSLDQMDWGYAPTKWQKSRYPDCYQNKISNIFDGIDTQKVRPLSKSKALNLQLKRPDGSTITLSTGDEIITFVNRNLEPYRGYHSFMRALPAIQKQRLDAITLIVGGSDTSYGAKPPEGKTWKQIFLDEVKQELDLSRIFFLDHIAYDLYLKILQISRCHVYLTYPFVLSWSCLEAMSTGCTVVGSKTPPVQEVIEHGVNGLLVDFFDTKQLANQVVEILANPEKFNDIRINARKTVVERYDLHSICLPKQIALIEDLVTPKN